ncbi:MAG TPA: HD-GYP domain-containing protein [Terriglobales bacterium]
MSEDKPTYEELRARVADLEKQHETERSYVANLEKLVTVRTEQLRQTTVDLERAYDITLEGLGDALDLKDAETEGHSKRVTAFTIAMARAMSLPGNKIRVIARGAFLHDIGKMAIPDSILRKPGDLTQEEIAIVQEHCYRGYQMLRKIPFLSEAADIVYCHEEKWDGTGYPRGLKGEEIPLGARIVAAAETFDAITSDQPYRTARSFSAACEVINRGSGRQFAPGIVKVFLTIPESIWHSLRKEIDQQIYRYQVKEEGNRS